MAARTKLSKVNHRISQLKIQAYPIDMGQSILFLLASFNQLHSHINLEFPIPSRSISTKCSYTAETRTLLLLFLFLLQATFLRELFIHLASARLFKRNATLFIHLIRLTIHQTSNLNCSYFWDFASSAIPAACLESVSAKFKAILVKQVA